MHIDDLRRVEALKAQFEAASLIRNALSMIVQNPQSEWKPSIYVNEHGVTLRFAPNAAGRLVQLLDAEMRAVLEQLQALGVETEPRDEDETQR